MEERLRFYDEGIAPKKNLTAMQEVIAGMPKSDDMDEDEVRRRGLLLSGVIITPIAAAACLSPLESGLRKAIHFSRRVCIDGHIPVLMCTV